MKIGFTGTQNSPTQKQVHAFVEIMKRGEGRWTEFHHGDCIGADARAAELVNGFFSPRRGFKLISHPPVSSVKRAYAPFDERWPEAEYLVRNRDIVACCEYLIAMPKTYKNAPRSGTWYTIRHAWLEKKSVTIIYPDGAFEPGPL